MYRGADVWVLLLYNRFLEEICCIRDVQVVASGIHNEAGAEHLDDDVVSTK